MAYHSMTWLVWLGAAASLALVNQQPLHSVLLILAAGSVFSVASRRHPMRQSWGTFLRFGLCTWLITLAFNLLSSHSGQMILFVLPKSWPLVGGPITLEALLCGVAEGASLFAVLLVFAAFNLGTDQHRLLRWVPAGLFQAGLIVSIALTFVPQMVQGLTSIRDAQRIRGHKVRGVRDLIPLFVPLVTTGLERSLTLAESMEARGFGGIVDERATPTRRTMQLMAPTGLLALLAGLVWKTLGPSTGWPGMVLLGLGIALIVVVLHLQSSQVKRTKYRREVWRRRDTLVSLACLASILITASVKAQQPSAMWYWPYPPFSPWPGFTPLIGLAAASVAAPAFLWPSPGESRRESRQPLENTECDL